jgi:hypothetical protein
LADESGACGKSSLHEAKVSMTIKVAKSPVFDVLYVDFILFRSIVTTKVNSVASLEFAAIHILWQHNRPFAPNQQALNMD